VFDNNGNLFGATFGGGALDIGTIFKLSKPASGSGAWNPAILHYFRGGTDGAGPEAGLVADNQGNLYGTTWFGGTTNGGTVFEVFKIIDGVVSQPEGPWPETVLHTFTDSLRDGAEPGAPLIFYGVDFTVLYGTTSAGGSICPLDPNGCGTVFSLQNPPPNLHQCSGGTEWCQRVNQCVPLNLFKVECLFQPVRPPITPPPP
jgi:uncharacterized repeat protein (TIGR03803 family)